jgi:hypothetical protein
MKHLMIVYITFAIGLTACSEPRVVFFDQKWNKDFHIRAMESGDTLAIGAVFCDGSRVFINDQATGTMVVLDRQGRKNAVITLQGIGRGSWCGDDFIVHDSVIMFINTVDKRLEHFSMNSGRHLLSQPLPLDALAKEKKRSRRIIDRIEINNGTVYIGNAHLLVPLEKGMQSLHPTSTPLTAPEGKRFALFGADRRIMETNGALTEEPGGKRLTLPATHYAVSGKRLFFLNNRLFAITAEKQGVRILEVK